jgi:hypothetical protein
MDPGRLRQLAERLLLLSRTAGDPRIEYELIKEAESLLADAAALEEASTAQKTE